MDPKRSQRYEALVAAVKRAIDAADSIGLRRLGAPADEYEPEVGTIVPRVARANDIGEVREIVHEEFANWFGVGTVGPATAYEMPARAIWEAVLKFRHAG